MKHNIQGHVMHIRLSTCSCDGSIKKKKKHLSRHSNGAILMDLRMKMPSVQKCLPFGSIFSSLRKISHRGNGKCMAHLEWWPWQKKNSSYRSGTSWRWLRQNFFPFYFVMHFSDIYTYLCQPGVRKVEIPLNGGGGALKCSPPRASPDDFIKEKIFMFVDSVAFNTMYRTFKTIHIQKRKGKKNKKKHELFTRIN